MYKTVKHSGCGRAGGGASGGSGEVRGSIGEKEKKKSFVFGFLFLWVCPPLQSSIDGAMCPG